MSHFEDFQAGHSFFRTSGPGSHINDARMGAAPDQGPSNLLCVYHKFERIEM